VNHAHLASFSIDTSRQSKLVKGLKETEEKIYHQGELENKSKRTPKNVIDNKFFVKITEVHGKSMQQTFIRENLYLYNRAGKYFSNKISSK
jgi:hypothetical protein